MKSRQPILFAVAVLMIGAAGFVLIRWARTTDRESSDFPDGTLWICGDAACKAELALPLADLADFYQKHPGEAPPCAKCGKPAVRASRCGLCKRAFARGTSGPAPRTCPLCGQPLPRLTGGSD